MAFADRKDAAQQLTERLREYRGQHPLVLAIPRGAVPMAQVIATKLDGELDVVLVRKLGAPGNPEYAIGAVDENGQAFVHDSTEYTLDAPYVQEEIVHQSEVLQQRRAYYTPHRAAKDPSNRTVILVDDGVATGSTMQAALQSVRRSQPQKLVVAVGVAPPEAVQRLQHVADEVVCLQMPQDFYAVGPWYDDFTQVSDEEVIDILRRSR